MKEFYQREIENETMKLELVKIGFKEKVKQIGASLLEQKSEEQTNKLVKILKNYQDIVFSIESNIEFLKTKLSEELNNEDNKRETAKEILFGGNK